MELETYDLAACVARGMERLREFGEPEWLLSPAGLDIADLGNCPLGQVFGDYYTGLGVLFNVGPDGLTEVEGDRLAIDHGFDAPGGRASYRALTDEWVRVIEQERNA